MIPVSASLTLALGIGDVAGDFAMDFSVAAPDLTDPEAYIFEIGELDQPPRPLLRLSPSYPPRARMRGLEGTVVVEFVVGRDGAVRDAEVVSAEPPGVFEHAARHAVSRWRFEPGMKSGVAVPARVRQRLAFSLEE
jgi:protein TonB